MKNNIKQLKQMSITYYQYKLEPQHQIVINSYGIIEPSSLWVPPVKYNTSNYVTVATRTIINKNKQNRIRTLGNTKSY